MIIEFKYHSDSKTGTATISCQKGYLSEHQKVALIKEITAQQATLINKEYGEFKPSKKIDGLPDGISFKFKFLKDEALARDVVLYMFFSDEVTEDKQRACLSEKHKNTNLNWTDLYVDILKQTLLELDVFNADKAEVVALRYSVEELQLLLKNGDEKSVLSLFVSYLYFNAASLHEIDAHKTSLFLLAARLLESKLNGEYSNKNDIFSENKPLKKEDISIFNRIYRYFFQRRVDK